jgi:hypothetical protein
MGRDTWQLRLLWLSSNYTEPSRIWYEIINDLEINKAFTKAAIIDKVNQMRKRKPIHFNKLTQKYEIIIDGLSQR